MHKNQLLLLPSLVAAVILVQEPGFSHGGGLNSQGCHNETKTGGYHCHRSSQDSPKQKKPKKTKKAKSERAKSAPKSQKQERTSEKDKTGKQSTKKSSGKASNKKKASSDKAVIKNCYDGDTCTTTSGEKIRLACIDAPEMGTGGKANAAKNKLEDLVVGKEVKIKRYEKDRYGRTVAEIFPSGGQSSSETLVDGGYAKVYDQYAYNCSWAINS